MTTALNIIERALLDLQVIEAGAAPSSQESKDALIYLNDLIQSLANEGLMINQVTSDTLSVSGASSYTIGSSGDINTTRPVQILSAYFTSSGVDYPVTIIPREQYEGITLKTNASTYPYCMYVEYGYPLATIYLYPVPSSGTLHLSSLKPLSSLASNSTVLSLPAGYERMLRLNLEVELMAQYGINNQLIMANAMKAKSDIKRVNAANRPIVADLGLPIIGTGYGNILNGWES